MAAVRGQSLAAASNTLPVQVKEEQVNAIQTHQPPRRRPNSGRQGTRTCGSCGYEHKTTTGCPAKGKTCDKCGKDNHFAKVCRSGRGWQGNRKGKDAKVRSVIKEVDESRTTTDQRDPVFEEDEDEDIFVISFTGEGKQKKRPPPMSNIQINGKSATVLIDTGA
ncbi:hypothetical protein NDU88_007178 [Pleurodeles waltl]|uniref:Uncharacterized protein n=1 Tax=Pleurodeles waltl TaxID=8319 RepID=A0AAV7NAS7_PLEWA|nr:hypothetical protein NDU88_007178 [Pleurodeles waltl]